MATYIRLFLSIGILSIYFHEFLHLTARPGQFLISDGHDPVLALAAAVIFFVKSC